MRLYRMKCLECLLPWESAERDTKCPFCDSELIYDTGQAER